MSPSTPPSIDAAVAAAKQELRGRLLDRRRRMSAADRDRAGAANAAHLLGALRPVGTVCAYLPLASEPLSAALLDELAAAGVRVLVPVVTGAAPLDWTDYSAARATAGDGPLPRRAGPVGIEQLDAPHLGPAAVLLADVVLVPALAVDRSGARLGRGGGHYDRTLALLDPVGGRRPVLAGVVDDAELLDAVPHDHLDVPLTHVVTPRGGLRPPA